jgi:3-hydroxyisobutyrate dehydrogenase-like beta-hydroxyacid dehydrogenase
MGLPICERLAAQGFEVATLARNPEGRERATRANLQSESKIGGVVASADIVVSAVSDDAALLDIVFQAGGLKETLHASQIFVEISTVSPSVSRRVAEAISAIGVGTFDRPCRAQRRWRRKEL